MPKSDVRLDLRSNQAYASQVAIPSIQNKAVFSMLYSAI